MRIPKTDIELRSIITEPENGKQCQGGAAQGEEYLRSDISSVSDQVLLESLYSPDERQIMVSLRELERRRITPDINLVNALFFSSTSTTLDRYCLCLVALNGDAQSRQFLHKKYPRVESLHMNLVPYYLNALAAVGEERDLELVGRIALVFAGLHREEVIKAFESISARKQSVEISHDCVRSLQVLYESAEVDQKIRILALVPRLVNGLLFSVLVCGIEDDHIGIRKTAVRVLAQTGTDFSRRELERHFRVEDDEEVLDEYASWLFHGEQQRH